MIWRWILIGAAVAGVVFGVFMVIRAAQQPVAAPPLVTPDSIPFERYIAGSGIVESSSDDIEVATPLSGVVEEVYVTEGEQIQLGDPLFRLEDRDLQAMLRLSEAELDVAKKQVAETISELDDKQGRLNLVNKLSDKRAISQEEVDNRRNAVRLARARLATANAEVERRQANVNVIETDLHRMTIRSPIDGEVLRVTIHPGEYAQAGPNAVPLMVIGSTNPLHVRTDIDENDAWRFDPAGAAVAVPRGNPQLQIPLEFVRVEPFVLPKRSLTGDTGERVDTRVLRIIYKFEKDGLPVYVGQQVDVSIAIPANETSDQDTSSDTSDTNELPTGSSISQTDSLDARAMARAGGGH